MECNFLLLLLIAVITLAYFYIKRCFSYWKDRNVVHLEPSLLYGNIKKVIKQEIPMTDVMDELYNKVKAEGKDFGGIYSFFTPFFVPVNLDLIKCMLQSDFSHFMNHGTYFNEKKEPITAHVFSLEDQKWKNLRSKLTPTFTSGKMKVMFQTLVDCGQGLKGLLEKAAGNKNGIDIKDIFSRFTIDVIASVGFGLDLKSMENPDTDFRKYALQVFDFTSPESKNFIILNFLPKWFANLLNLRIVKKEIEDYYLNTVKATVKYREQNNIYRKDFLHLLIQLKNLGKIGDDDNRSLMGKNTTDVEGITLNEIAAQCFLFFIAGFETSSSTMTYALLELAQRQDIQDKLREEINTVLEKHGNEITYDAIAEMEYLEKAVLETLRKHPPVAVIPRICNKTYKIPNSTLVLEKGTQINIPVSSIQRDPDYYPDPDKFDPERFNEENKAKRHAMTFLSFGEGPRTCIGMRLGKLQSKVGLICVLRNYKVTLHERTQLPVKYKMVFTTAVEGEVWINLESLT